MTCAVIELLVAIGFAVPETGGSVTSAVTWLPRAINPGAFADVVLVDG